MKSILITKSIIGNVTISLLTYTRTIHQSSLYIFGGIISTHRMTIDVPEEPDVEPTEAAEAEAEQQMTAISFFTAARYIRRIIAAS